MKKSNIIFILLVLFIGLLCVDKIQYRIVKYMPAKIDNYLAGLYLDDKFWLHRVNSIGKQKEFSEKYSGIEFDIIFHNEELAFENSHDIESIAKYNFEEQLKVYKELGNNNGIWLDFKNLKEENKYNALSVLEGLLLKYSVDKSKVWLESSNWQSLDVFVRNGYNTSYYLPYYDFSKMSEAEIELAKIKTENIAKSGNIKAISFYGKYYDFVKKLELPPILFFCLG